MKTIDELETLNSCKEGLTWAKSQPSLAEAWEKCERSDWMWWLLKRLNKCPKELSVEYAKWCADSVKHLYNSNTATAATATADAAYATAATATAADAAVYATARIGFAFLFKSDTYNHILFVYVVDEIIF